MPPIDIGKLTKLLEEQLKIYTKLLELESSKTDVLLKGELEALDNIVTEQQPYIMSSANCEKRREKLLDEAGLGGYTLRQIIDEFPEAKPLESVFNQLSDVVIKLRKATDKNKTIINTKLRVVNYILSKSGASEDRMITYSNLT